MKNITLITLALALMVLSGCSVIGGIFKAGAAVGIISVIVVIVIIFWLLSLFRRKS
jgi:hypothetical protein